MLFFFLPISNLKSFLSYKLPFFNYYFENFYFTSKACFFLFFVFLSITFLKIILHVPCGYSRPDLWGNSDVWFMNECFFWTDSSRLLRVISQMTVNNLFLRQQHSESMNPVGAILQLITHWLQLANKWKYDLTCTSMWRILLKMWKVS